MATENSLTQSLRGQQIIFSKPAVICPLCKERKSQHATGVCGPCRVAFIADSRTGERKATSP